MNINWIKIENFLSIKEAYIDFNKFPNIVHIKGVNQDTRPYRSNGSGKSSIIEAIYFCGFGKTIRKTTEKSLKNSRTKGKCKVTMQVNDSIVITRVKKPPSLTVEVDGNPYNGESLSETQSKLEKLLNINDKVFLASMVYGQRNEMNFLTASPDAKRDILQSFLNVSDVFKYRGVIKTIKSENLLIKKVQQALMDNSYSSKAAIDEEIKTLKRYKRETDIILGSEKSKYIKKFSLTDIKEQERKQQELSADISRLEYELKTFRTMLERNIAEVKSIDDAKCEHCLKVPLKTYRRKQELEDYIIKGRVNISTLQKEIKKNVKIHDSSSIPITSQDIETVENIKNFESQLDFFKTQRKSTELNIKNQGAELAQAQKTYDMSKFWEQAFSEQGLIKYVIRNILSYFNDRTNYYLGILSKGTFTIKFNDILEEVIYNNNEEVYYPAISGGEQKMVGMAVMLSLNDLLALSGKNRSNLVFLDEIADSLDDLGVRGLYELIDKLSKDKKLFIITHNDYLVSLLEDEAYELKAIKKNGITKIR